MYICIDFDGTIVTHEYPLLGSPVPNAIYWMKRFQRNGAKLILFTMRHGPFLSEAVKYLEENGIVFHGINNNPEQSKWSDSRKVYGNIYIDDAAFGCPLIDDSNFDRKYVDWNVVGPAINKQLIKRQEKYLKITSFSGEYSFLSNFYSSEINYGGILYPTSEHAFQAQKSLDEQTKIDISKISTPGKSKREAKKIKLRGDWEEVKLGVMKSVLTSKFDQHPALKEKLIQTGKSSIIEENNWGDVYWGVCSGIGENHLGIILMELRKEFSLQMVK